MKTSFLKSLKYRRTMGSHIGSGGAPDFGARPTPKAPRAARLLRMMAIGSLMAAPLMAGADDSNRLSDRPNGREMFSHDQVIVRFRANAPENDRIRARMQGLIKRARRLSLVRDMEILTVQDGVSVEETIRSLRGNPMVEYAEPDYVLTTTAVPNDPSYSSQWGLVNARAEAAWNSGAQIAPNGLVAIIDTGIELNHPDLKANLWVNPREVAGDRIDNDGNGYVDDVTGWNWVKNSNNPNDDRNHGTHVAGIVGAVSNNRIGVAGTMWGVKLMALKICDATGHCLTSSAIKALDYATKMGAKVSNSSWGGYSYSQALYDAIKASKAVGHVLVASAGNEARNSDSQPHYPSAYNLDNVIAVASITSGDALSSFSNFGVKTVDLGAPGSGIFSTWIGNTYNSASGTSMASPFVAGAVAMLYNARPWWRYQTVRDTILKTARPIAALAGKTLTGGTLDMAAAINAAAMAPEPGEAGFSAPLKIVGYVQGLGYREGREEEWVGTKNAQRRLQGFNVNFITPDYTPDLGLEYTCRTAGSTDRPWMPAGTFCGSTGYKKNMNRFAMRLTGPAAASYDVFYFCWSEYYGTRGPYKNGEFCANGGGPDNRGIETMRVFILKK